MCVLWQISQFASFSRTIDQAEGNGRDYKDAYWCIAGLPLLVAMVAGVVDAFIRAPGSIASVCVQCTYVDINKL